MANYIIALGSNQDAAENLLLARELLTKDFPNIRFSTEEETEPIGCKINLSLFHNQLATFFSDKSIEEINVKLKEIEALAGRSSEEKSKEIIRLDIDILAANNQILRSKDWGRRYVQRGIAELHITLPDRNQQPPTKEINELDILPPEHIILPNGIPLYILRGGHVEVTRIDFVFKGGRWHQTHPLQALFTNRMLREGSRHYASKEIAEKLDYYGAWLELSTSSKHAFATLYSLGKYLPQTLELLESILKEPLFPEKELEVIKEINLQQHHINLSKVDYSAHRTLINMLFGSLHPNGYLTKEKDYKAITAPMLREFFEEYYHSENCAIFVSGNLSNNHLHHLKTLFGTTPFGACRKSIENKPHPIISSPHKRLFIEHADAQQSAIRMGIPTIGVTHPDFPKLRTLITLLGGYFGSRLMSNIRENKGYTYHIAASLAAYPGEGVIVINTETSNELVEPLIREVYHEIERLQNELVPQDELTTLKNYIVGEMCRSYETIFSIAEAWIYFYTSHLQSDYFTTTLNSVKQISSHDLRELAGKYLLSEQIKESVAGKKMS